jgi:hypothetical protein
MTVRGSEIRQLIIAGREMDPVAEANVTYRLSGFQNEPTPTGNGGVHVKQTRKLGGFESLPISVDPSRKDLEFLQGLADAGEPVPMSMTTAVATYSGNLVISDALDANTGDGQVELSAMGYQV